MGKYLSVIVLLLLASVSSAKNTLSEYQRTFTPVYTADGKLMIALRVMKMNEIPSFLAVDPESLQTKVLPIAQLKSRNIQKIGKDGTLSSWSIASTRYYQLLNKSTAAPYLLENQGVRHASHAGEGVLLTIDLCPSAKPFEAEFFNKLVQLAEKNKKPTPVTIAISGLWLLEHPDEFQWLLIQEKEKKLDITWANHSFSHVYYADSPFSQNFLLIPETNIETEILLTEKYLLEAGEMPSVFFRFPGLVSSKSLMNTIKLYGLIPLGTDAWMAHLQTRHEEITPGGIILVHGNSNEHEGIVVVMSLLDELKLLDIRQSI